MVCVASWQGDTRRSQEAEAHESQLRSKILEIVKPHMQALLRRRRQLSHVDDYGIRHDVKWQKEINYFCDKIVFPALGTQPPLISRADQTSPRMLPEDSIVYALVESEAIDVATEFAVQFDAGMSPIDYEHFCAERLKLSGWTPRVTQTSGDQGADIVAVKGKTTIVIQCKHYQAPVGNKAVQEVVAAVSHYRADAGIVIATNGFTRSAHELAASNGVQLLSHDDLTAQWQL